MTSHDFCPKCFSLLSLSCRLVTNYFVDLPAEKQARNRERRNVRKNGPWTKRRTLLKDKINTLIFQEWGRKPFWQNFLVSLFDIVCLLGSLTHIPSDYHGSAGMPKALWGCTKSFLRHFIQNHKPHSGARGQVGGSSIRTHCLRTIHDCRKCTFPSSRCWDISLHKLNNDFGAI